MVAPSSSNEQRAMLAVVSAILLATIQVVIDWATWVELNVSIVYGLPLIVAAVARSRQLLWGLMAFLVTMTFAVYFVQIPADKFTLVEPLFINRVLAALTLAITASLLHLRLRAIDKLAAQDEVLKEANQCLQRANEELEVRRCAAEEASQRKTRFLASMSHDIRTPINAINLMAEIMCRTAENPKFPGELPDIARRLKANALSLSDLLSDVIDIARFDSGRIELHPSHFSLNDLLNEHSQALLPLAQAKGLNLVVEAPQPPSWVYIDRVKLSRIVANLLTNAIKYTDSGTVTARVCVSPDRAVSIEVQDTGVGIPAESLESIFDEYAQLSNPDRDPAKGWGLGLPICKRLINLLGGGISVSSEPNVGSIFTIRLASDCICERPCQSDAGPGERADAAPCKLVAN